MELRILRYFLAVAREENITKAAELLHNHAADIEPTAGTVRGRCGSNAVFARRA